jgi:hypothetical protein
MRYPLTYNPLLNDDDSVVLDNGSRKVFQGSIEDCRVFAFAYRFANPYEETNIASGRWFTSMKFLNDFYYQLSLARRRNVFK